MAILMFVDGVLRGVTGAPIKQGFSLYHTLRSNNRVLLLCKNKERDDRWLKENKINLVDDLIGSEIPAMQDYSEFRQVEHCRSTWQIDFVVTADTTLAAKLLESGITTLMLLHPIYMDEKFRPDGRQGVKPWGDIVAAIESQQDTFSEDPRVQ